MIMAQLVTDTGEALAETLELPEDTTGADLQEVLQTFRATDPDDISVKYSFFIGTTEVRGSLQQAVEAAAISTETTVIITCRPLALFAVKPVSRSVATLEGHTEGVLDVSFNPDSMTFASASGDTTIRIWDALTLTCKHVLRGHKNWVLKVAYSPCATRLASAGVDGELRVWDPITNRALHSRALIGHKKFISSLAWQPLPLLPVESISKTSRMDGLIPTNTSLRLATGSKDGTVRMWNVDAGVVEHVVHSGTKCVTDVRWTRDNYLLVSSEDTQTYVYSTPYVKDPLIKTNSSSLQAQYCCLAVLKNHGHWVNSLALNTDYLQRYGPRISVAMGPAYYKQMLTQREMVLTCSDDQTINLYDMAALLEDIRATIHEKADGTDRHFIALSCKPLTRLTGHAKPVNHVCFSPNGQYIASASFDRTVRLWDGVTGKHISIFRNHVNQCYRVSFSSDSRFLISCGKDSTCKLYSLTKRTMLRDLPGHEDEVYAIDWALNGDIAISGSKDRTVRVWRN